MLRTTAPKLGITSMGESLINGKCLCGNVKYEVSGKLSDIIHCHCETCRKAHGSAFSSIAFTLKENFQVIGEEFLNSYESSKGKHRYFCKNCGTQVYAQRTDTNYIVLRLGSIEGKLPVKESSHIWLSNKASWFSLDSCLERYENELPKT